MNNSVWSENVKLPSFKPLKGNAKTDVLIVGGGMCGILCAHFLDKAGVKYILAEGGKICGGVTGNTTAKITAQHGLIYDKLIKSEGKTKAEMYLKANTDALLKYRELAQGIDCDFEERDSYVYSRLSRSKLEREVDALLKLGVKAKYIEPESLPLPFENVGAVRFPGQAQFNPLKFIAGIVKGLNIYENTFISEVSDGEAKYGGGTIRADNIIIATHFPFINKYGSYFLKMYQHRSYVTALSGAPLVDGMYVDEAKDGISLRSYKDLLLVGGGGHRTGKQGGGYEELKRFKNEYYTDSKEQYSWATQDCISLDGVPYIGNYSKHTSNLYVATGFNKWGMTSAMAAAVILNDMLTHRRSEYAEVFSPSRSMMKPQLFANAAESVANLLIPKTRRCTHLGCALNRNKAEHTWDCPCHGSRYDENGGLIIGPAMKNANVKK